MKKGKKKFWLLAFVFSVWFLLVCSFLWLDNNPEPQQPMNMMLLSMSQMMRSETIAPTLLDLLQINKGSAQSKDNTEGHHSSSGIMGKVHTLCTTIIFMSLPIIVGVSVILMINWI